MPDDAKPAGAPPLAPKVAAALASLREAGAVVTDAEVAWLVRLRDACDRPHDGSIPWLPGAPVQYAGDTFWPWHRLAKLWYKRIFGALSFDDPLYTIAYLFAHTRSAPGDVSLRMLTAFPDAARAVSDWWDASALHDEQVNALVDRIMALDGADPEQAAAERAAEKPSKASIRTATDQDIHARVVARLMRQFPGTTAEYWTTSIDDGTANRIERAGDSLHGTSTAERDAAVGRFLAAVKSIMHRAVTNG
jgi:hypothetical protein